ncbi:hypothetical protein [Meiothermus sp.]|uniref:hypothetical protein n=1 Tax=Meiothermus sp. TaxID=1955249 RepID=UPI0021DC7593|nr:hypothetical protein [Meiothermus sp.]GIW33755.1 MAG: hypothetical protein KatS3mg072_1088 [Meiothermus sp.]
MLLQTPDDVARELRRNPGREFDLTRPGCHAPIRIYARQSGLITMWAPEQSRPIHGIVKLTAFELGEGPYELSPV